MKNLKQATLRISTLVVVVLSVVTMSAAVSIVILTKKNKELATAKDKEIHLIDLCDSIQTRYNNLYNGLDSLYELKMGAFRPL